MDLTPDEPTLARRGHPPAPRQQIRTARALALLLVAVCFVVGTIHAVDSLGGPVAIRDRFGPSGVAISFAAHWLLNLTPAGEILPSAMANGAAWGFWLGAGVSWLGWVAASLTQYGLALRLGTRIDIDRRLELLPARIRAFPVAHPVFQILGRMVPVVGLHFVNVASAARRVPLARFVACALAGHAGPALTMSAVGAGLIRLL